jgi:hypothetical protein
MPHISSYGNSLKAMSYELSAMKYEILLLTVQASLSNSLDKAFQKSTSYIESKFKMIMD